MRSMPFAKPRSRSALPSVEIECEDREGLLARCSPKNDVEQ